MISRSLMYLTLVLFAAATVCADEPLPPHVQFWKNLDGHWTYKLSPGDVEGKVTWRLRTRGNTLMGWFTDSNGVVSTEVSGWRADENVLVVNGFGDSKNYWHLRFPKVTGTSVEGTATGIRPDGTEYEGKFVGSLEDGNVYRFSVEGKTKDGKPLKFQGVFTKETRDTVSNDQWKTPWKWLLGSWDVKRSDGTSARVHWKKPNEHAEMLIGNWKESDGTELNEVVGWHPDSQMLVAHAYGEKGAYFWVRFNEVASGKLKGFFGNRNAKGETKRGAIEIEVVSDGVVKSKMTASDGTVVTETLTRAQK